MKSKNTSCSSSFSDSTSESQDTSQSDTTHSDTTRSDTQSDSSQSESSSYSESDSSDSYHESDNDNNSYDEKDIVLLKEEKLYGMPKKVIYKLFEDMKTRFKILQNKKSLNKKEEHDLYILHKNLKTIKRVCDQT